MIASGQHVSREPGAARVIVAAVIVLGVATALADRHPGADRWVFSTLNHHRDEPRLLRVLQQFGTPWMLPGTAALAAACGCHRLAVAAGIALPLEKGLEVGVKKLRPTPRPLYVQPTVLRDDAPVEGGSFPSGHAAIAWTTVTLTAPYLSRHVAAALAASAVVSSGVRVAQGAHHPVDAIGGAALGIGLGAALTWAIGRRVSPFRDLLL